MYDPDLHSIKWTGKHVFILFCVVLNNFITFFLSKRPIDLRRASLIKASL